MKLVYANGELKEQVEKTPMDTRALFEQLKAMGVSTWKCTLDGGEVLIEVDKTLSQFQVGQLKASLDGMNTKEISQGGLHE